MPQRWLGGSAIFTLARGSDCIVECVDNLEKGLADDAPWRFVVSLTISDTDRGPSPGALPRVCPRKAPDRPALTASALLNCRGLFLLWRKYLAALHNLSLASPVCTADTWFDHRRFFLLLSGLGCVSQLGPSLVPASLTIVQGIVLSTVGMVLEYGRGCSDPGRPCLRDPNRLPSQGQRTKLSRTDDLRLGPNSLADFIPDQVQRIFQGQQQHPDQRSKH
jgi:hypothetical protein